MYLLNEHIDSCRLHSTGDSFPGSEHAVLLLGREGQAGVGGCWGRGLITGLRAPSLGRRKFSQLTTHIGLTDSQTSSL